MGNMPINKVTRYSSRKPPKYGPKALIQPDSQHYCITARNPTVIT